MGSELTFRSGLHDVLPTTFGYIGVGLASVLSVGPAIYLYGLCY